MSLLESSSFHRYVERHSKEYMQPVKVGKEDATHIKPTITLVDVNAFEEQLYGLYAPKHDIIGGQWSALLESVTRFAASLRKQHGKVVAVLEGPLSPNALGDWRKRTQNMRRAHSRLNNSNSKQKNGAFIAPPCFKQALRLALSAAQVEIHSSIGDSAKDMVSIYEQGSCTQIISFDSVLILRDVQCLPFHCAVEKFTVPVYVYQTKHIKERLGLTDENTALFWTLTGNRMNEKYLSKFFQRLLSVNSDESSSANKQGRSSLSDSDTRDDTIIYGLLSFVKAVTPTDYQTIAAALAFMTTLSVDEIATELEECVAYFHSESGMRKRHAVPRSFSAESDDPFSDEEWDEGIWEEASMEEQHYQMRWQAFQRVHCQGVRQTGLASVQCSLERSLQLKETLTGLDSLSLEDSALDCADELPIPADEKPAIHQPNAKMRTSSSGSSNARKIPVVPMEVRDTIYTRHVAGECCPAILQLLKLAEIEIEACLDMEDDNDTPSTVLLYRPIRRFVYGVLFGQEMCEKAERCSADSSPRPDFVVYEWCSRRGKGLDQPDEVTPKALPSPVPPISQLWFGSLIGAADLRLQAFLQCMHCNEFNVSNEAIVPKRLVILCCVLRYLTQRGVLSNHDIDAFLAQALSPHLCTPNNATNLAHLKLQRIDNRAVHLSAVFMAGVEMALLANDACGSPIAMEFSYPWVYFDGRLFHQLWLVASSNASLLELYNGKANLIERHERLYWCVTEGHADKVQSGALSSASKTVRRSSSSDTPAWLRTALPEKLRPGPPCAPATAGIPPAGVRLGSRGRGRAANQACRRPGGTLQVAGVPVSKWSGAGVTTGFAGKGVVVGGINSVELPSARAVRNGNGPRGHRMRGSTQPQSRRQDPLVIGGSTGSDLGSHHVTGRGLHPSPPVSAPWSYDFYDQDSVRNDSRKQNHNGQRHFNGLPMQTHKQQGGYVTTTTMNKNHSARQHRPPPAPVKEDTDLWLGRGRGRASFIL